MDVSSAAGWAEVWEVLAPVGFWDAVAVAGEAVWTVAAGVLGPVVCVVVQPASMTKAITRIAARIR
jgi:hypothetical protein